MTTKEGEPVKDSLPQKPRGIIVDRMIVRAAEEIGDLSWPGFESAPHLKVVGTDPLPKPVSLRAFRRRRNQPPR